tara:strand:- start:219 stop:368 length:150 start_codon:yes stop_codon:yes gene_type:complete
MIYLLDELVRGKAPSVKIGKGRASDQYARPPTIRIYDSASVGSAFSLAY